MDKITIERDKERQEEALNLGTISDKKDLSGYFNNQKAKLAGDKKEAGKDDKEGIYKRFNAKSEYTLTNSLTSRFTGAARYKNNMDGSDIIVKSKSVIVSSNHNNIAAGLDIAQDKGWGAIKIKGGNRQTKAEIWFQAQMRGLETSGYSPSKEDLKRLSGAQEREKQEGLDIKPVNNNDRQKGNSSQEQARETIKNPQKGNNKTAGKDGDYLSEDERFARFRNEIMAEVEKVMPLDEKNRSELQDAIDEQLAHARKSGVIKLDRAKEEITKGLPLVRNELEQAGMTEQRRQQTQAKEAKTITINKKETKEPEREALQR